MKTNNKNGSGGNGGAFDKDTRTIFVNQLVMRTRSKDIRNYFRKKVGAKVNEVSLLTDRRTGKHKGCAYIEMRTMDDVHKALAVSGQTPDWQRFPILIKPSEAEKNYVVPVSASTATAMAPRTTAPPIKPLLGPNGLPIEAQKVYVGSLDPRVSQDHLFQLFHHFGDLQKVNLQMDPNTGISKGYAFLKFHDPKDANLAIQTMAGQVLAGRPLKTGWASQTVGSSPGVPVVTSDEFPDDASEKAQKGLVALTQLALNGVGGIGSTAVIPSAVANMADAALNTAMGEAAAAATAASPLAATTSKVPTVAEARQILATQAAGMTMPSVPIISPSVPTPTPGVQVPDATVIGRAENPSPHVLVHNMYDKDEETEAGWAEDIKLEFMDECSKYGKIERVLVMSNEPGGKIYASFDSVEAAKTCASSLAGRWFDRRQLRVEFLDEKDIPKEA